MSDLKRCSFCVMDQTNPDIVFDEKGICNNCKEYTRNMSLRMGNTQQNNSYLERVIDRVKKAGRGRPYDCVIGVSGGADSTFLAYKVKSFGLKALAVHFDNGWNSRLAVTNIEKTLKVLDIDLYTYVINWEEFKDLQLSFLKAATPDGEIPTDHAILATMFKAADDNNVKYILMGNNYNHEGLMPQSWAYGHIDWHYIKNIHKNFGRYKLKTYPHITIGDLIYLTVFKRIKRASLLNYIPYEREDAIKLLQNELGWEPYGWKHHESIYTRFYQSYVLPRKFNIDKRKAHLSTQICSGLISREEALQELKKDIYPQDKEKEDKEFVLKKLGITETEFDNIMTSPNKSFKEYKNKYNYHKTIRRTINLLRSYNVLYK